MKAAANSWRHLADILRCCNPKFSELELYAAKELAKKLDGLKLLGCVMRFSLEEDLFQVGMQKLAKESRERRELAKKTTTSLPEGTKLLLRKLRRNTSTNLSLINQRAWLARSLAPTVPSAHLQGL